MIAANTSFSDSKAAITIRNIYYRSSSLSKIFCVIILIVLYNLIIYLLTKKTNSAVTFFLILQLKDTLLGFFYMLILIVCSINKPTANRFWLTKILSWHPLVFVGTFSYSLYLIHAPLIQLLTQWVIFPLKLNPYRFNYATIGYRLTAYNWFCLFILFIV